MNPFLYTMTIDFSGKIATPTSKQSQCEHVSSHSMTTHFSENNAISPFFKNALLYLQTSISQPDIPVFSYQFYCPVAIQIPQTSISLSNISHSNRHRTFDFYQKSMIQTSQTKLRFVLRLSAQRLFVCEAGVPSVYSLRCQVRLQSLGQEQKSMTQHSLSQRAGVKGYSLVAESEIAFLSHRQHHRHNFQQTCTSLLISQTAPQTLLDFVTPENAGSQITPQNTRSKSQNTRNKLRQLDNNNYECL